MKLKRYSLKTSISALIKYQPQLDKTQNLEIPAQIKWQDSLSGAPNIGRLILHLLMEYSTG